MGIGLFASSVSRTVEAFTVDVRSASENVATGATPVGTPVAPAAGVTERTSGGTGVVVKSHTTLAAKMLPATSFTLLGPMDPPATSAEYLAPATSGSVGSSVAVNVAAS